MAFADGLQDLITIYTISIAFKAGDTVGQQVKTEVLLYSSVPGRLNSTSNVGINTSRNTPGKQEQSKYSWILEMKPEHNGANRGDKVVANSQNYIIARKHEIRGKTSAIHHVVYYLEEAE
jgi:hypothetical protein